MLMLRRRCRYAATDAAAILPLRRYFHAAVIAHA